MFRFLIALIFAFASFTACESANSDASTCQRHFVPYQDLISGQARNARNGAYLDAMAHYSAGEFAAAATGLESYLEQRGAARSANIYLACSYLALGRPYDAELRIDRLENSHEQNFADQCAWYTVLCWLCSDQIERARTGAQSIAQAPRHTYKAEAKRLLDELNTKRP
ncbi:MAG: hypothetical protein IPL52_16640 [Flavobacteriales bacterium]|nr:hypothetical protein [Flavobacteriales bacterium]